MSEYGDTKRYKSANKKNKRKSHDKSFESREEAGGRNYGYNSYDYDD